MSDKKLRKAVIRLAHENPKLRDHLLPLVSKQAATVSSGTTLSHMYGESAEAWFSAAWVGVAKGLNQEDNARWRAEGGQAGFVLSDVKDSFRVSFDHMKKEVTLSRAGRRMGERHFRNHGHVPLDVFIGGTVKWVVKMMPYA